MKKLLSSNIQKAFVPLLKNQKMFVMFKAFYHDRVIDHFNNPRNVGTFDSSQDNVGTAIVGAPACGDVMKLQIKVNVSGNKQIEDTCFKTFGCGSAIASSSFATELIKGMKIDEAKKLTNKVISDHLNLPPIKLHCSMLAEQAIQAAIADYVAKTEGLKDKAVDSV